MERMLSWEPYSQLVFLQSSCSNQSCQGSKDHEKMLFIMVTYPEWNLFQKSKRFIEASQTPGYSGPGEEQGSRERYTDYKPGSRWFLGLGSSSATDQLCDLEQIN